MLSKLIDDRVQYYKDQQVALSNGVKNSIPFYGLNRLNKIVPGFRPGIMMKITSHSGMGKTQFAKFLLYKAVEYAKKYKVRLTIYYIALEESREEFIDSLFIYLLNQKFNKTLKREKLEGIIDETLNDFEMSQIETIASNVAEYMSYIEVIDSVYKPTQIYNKLRYEAVKHGRFVDETLSDGTVEEKYIPNNKNHKFIVVCDHISLIEEEYNTESGKFLTKSASIAKWHTEYCRKIITKKWKWCGLNIQQQSLESEKEQYTVKGESILSKILPSLEGVANNREVIRDDYVVLGLFSPDRYGIKSFRGLTINQELGVVGDELKDNFRSIHVLKNRLGNPNGVLPLFFNGKVNYFEEMPPPIPSNTTTLDNFYKLSKQIRDEV